MPITSSVDIVPEIFSIICTSCAVMGLNIDTKRLINSKGMGIKNPNSTNANPICFRILKPNKSMVAPIPNITKDKRLDSSAYIDGPYRKSTTANAQIRIPMISFFVGMSDDVVLSSLYNKMDFIFSLFL